jgi:hypothetical protein
MRNRPLGVRIGRHTPDALAVSHLAAVAGELVIAFGVAHLIIGRPQGSISGRGHIQSGSKVRAGPRTHGAKRTNAATGARCAGAASAIEPGLRPAGDVPGRRPA